MNLVNFAYYFFHSFSCIGVFFVFLIFLLMVPIVIIMYWSTVEEMLYVCVLIPIHRTNFVLWLKLPTMNSFLRKVTPITSRMTRTLARVWCPLRKKISAWTVTGTQSCLFENLTVNGYYCLIQLGGLPTILYMMENWMWVAFCIHVDKYKLNY